VEDGRSPRDFRPEPGVGTDDSDRHAVYSRRVREGAEPRRARIAAIDVMRGLVMVLMSTDHASGVFNGGHFTADSASGFSPGTPIPPAQFLTRWISHLCAPTFVALAGTALAISTEARRSKGASEGAIDRHILVRGLVLLGLEVAWMSWLISGAWGRVFLQVLYAIGGSLLAMVVLRRLRERTLLAFGAGLSLGSELLLLAFERAGLDRSVPVAMALRGGVFREGHVIIIYPLLPWLALMCFGWVLGRRLVAWHGEGKDETRLASAALVRVGAVSLAVFVVLRGWNGFGNMRLLRDGAGILQWLHVSKYPPSATFIALEIGLGAFILAGLLRLGPRGLSALAPLRLLGETALFYYLLHIHLLVLVGWIFGLQSRFGVASAYVGAAFVLVALYPACAYYRRYKVAHPTSWTKWI
jgi:uncharacterized membrane protein